ncbi:MAG: GNAT family N-acetyltransferase [bacterium]
MVRIFQVESEDGLHHIRELFKEYIDWLGLDLSFQDFDKEYADLPGEYSAPNGCLLLAMDGEDIAGCVGLRKIAERICEMKRLYVRPGFRRKGIGRSLSLGVIEKARGIGYERMRLDTVPWMKEAIALYRSLGFKEIAPYRYNPMEGAKFLELVL